MLSYQWGSAYGCTPDIPWLAGDTRALATCALGLTRPRTLLAPASHPTPIQPPPTRPPLRIFHTFVPFFYRPREHCIFIVYRHSSLEICARFHFREGARVQVIYFFPKLSLINADSLYLGSVCNNLIVFRVIELTPHTSKFAHDYSNSFSHSSLQCIRSNNSNCFIYRSKDYQ